MMKHSQKLSEFFTRRRDIIAIVVFLIFILLVWAGFSSMPATPVIMADITDGVYDLRDFDFENNILSIPAEQESWESWPEKLYTPEDFSFGRVREAPVTIAREDYTRIQYATHRLRLILPPGNNDTYGISMKTADYAMRIYFDDKEIDCVGVPAATKEETIPRVSERVYYFTPQNENVDILVQTSNFVHHDGCQPPGFSIGKAPDINRKLEKERFLSAFIAGCFFMSCVYHLALFVLNRKRITALIFSICCSLMIFMVWPVFRLLGPDYNWYIAFQVEYLVHFGTFAMLSLLVHKLFPGLYNKHIVRCYLAFCGLFALSTFILSTKVYSGLLIYFHIPSGMMILYTLIRFAIAVFKKKPDANNDNVLRTILGFLGMSVLCIFAVNDIFFYYGVGLIGRFGYLFTAPLGMLLFVVCYALIVSIEYAETENVIIEAKEKERTLSEHIEILRERVKNILTHRNTESKKAPARRISKGSLELDLIALRAYVEGSDINLSPKEFSLLHILILNEGKTMNADDIYKTVWNLPLNDGASNTVRFQISRMRKKLAGSGYTITSVYGSGYCFEKE